MFQMCIHNLFFDNRLKSGSKNMIKKHGLRVPLYIVIFCVGISCLAHVFYSKYDVGVWVYVGYQFECIFKVS